MRHFIIFAAALSLRSMTVVHDSTRSSRGAAALQPPRAPPIPKARGAARRAQNRSGRRRGRPPRLHPEDGRFRVQLRRARIPGDRNVEIPDQHPAAAGLHHRGRHLGHPDGVDGHVGIGKAGHRARLRHRRHSDRLAEAGRGVSRPVFRRRSRSRRRTQLGHAAEHHRCHRAEEDHAAREDPGHDQAVAGRRRRAACHKGLLRPRRLLQGRRRRPLHAHRQQLGRELGRRHEQRAGLGRVHLQRRERALGGRAVARPQRARRRDADGHRLELSPRAPAHSAALALGHHLRRQSAERRPAVGVHLVLLPRNRLPEHQTHVGTRRQHGQGARR